MILLINSDSRYRKDRTPLQNFEAAINHAGSLPEADQIDSPAVEQLTNNDVHHYVHEWSVPIFGYF